MDRIINNVINIIYMLCYVHIILCSTANDSIVYMRLTTTNERYNKNIVNKYMSVQNELCE